MDSEWSTVHDEKRTYYYNLKSGECSWVLPSEFIPEPEVALLEERKVESKAEEQTEQDEEDEEDDDLEGLCAIAAYDADQWAVKLHPDSGQIFYHSSMDNISSWSNPLEENDLKSIMRSVEDNEMDESEVAVLEDMSGFHLAPDRNVFQSDEAEQARSRLTKWVQNKQIEVGAGVRT